MAKKNKPSSKDLVDSILDDLQKDNGDVDSSDDDDANDGQFVAAETRFLPEGLESETAIFGFSKKKPETPVTKLPAVSGNDGSFRPSNMDFPPIPRNEDATQNLSDSSSTRKLNEDSSQASGFRPDYGDRTQPMIRSGTQSHSDSSTKVSHGFSRPIAKSNGGFAASVTEAQMLQAENLKMAQARIMDLEKEVEILRQENELLASAGEIAKKRAEELFEKAQEIERMKVDSLDQAQMEMNIYRENLVDKDRQLGRLRQKIDELQSRLAKDLKKIRVRERELENRLELSKMEKVALVRAKDDAILDLKNKVDQLHSDLETYKVRCSELGQKVDGQHEQLGRTVRALRLALTHLESNDSTGNVTPLKKAE